MLFLSSINFFNSSVSICFFTNSDEEINSSNIITSQSSSEIELSSKKLLSVVENISENINSLESMVGLNERTAAENVHEITPHEESEESITFEKSA